MVIVLPNTRPWILATHNAGKVTELQDTLRDWGIALHPASDFPYPAPEETGDSFVANATLKAQYYATRTGLWALADDSGFCVDALDGAPGVHSADWALNAPSHTPHAHAPRDFTLAMQRVWDRLAALPSAARIPGASFVCVLALAAPEGRVWHVEGRCHGEWVWPPRGTGGFGYDPMFVPAGYTETFGELPAAVKQQISHRACAIAALQATLHTLFPATQA